MMEQNKLNQIDNVMSRGVERRLEFIEYRLYWEGGVNRADIKDKFGVSVPQASNDLTQYRELAPSNIRYDASEKRYMPTPEFKPLFLKPNAGKYLVELSALAASVLTPAELWVGSSPEVGVMPILGRRLSPAILRLFLQAIRDRKSIHTHYHSMSDKRPEAIWRWVTPHAFGSDGLRWHLRAYCHLEGRFKDFLLSRFIDVGEFGPPGAEPASDRDWYSFFDVILEPNPALAEAKRKTIALDYEMPEGRLVLPVRRALLYYFNKRLRLDVAEALDDPHEVPVVVINRKEFDGALKHLTQPLRRDSTSKTLEPKK